MVSTACSPASAATRSRPAPRSGPSRRAAARGAGTCATSRRSSGTTSTPRRRRARICAFIRSCIGLRQTSGPIRGARAFRSFRSIWRATDAAIDRWAMPTSPSRWCRTRARSRRSSPSSTAPRWPSAPAAPWTTNRKMRSSGCASPAISRHGSKYKYNSKYNSMNVLVTEPLASFAASAAKRPLVRIVIAGHVDHGKSTLVGRLLHETGSLPEGKLEQLKAVSTRRGMPFEWSFLLDALQTERDQGITLDTSQIRFRTASRDIVLIDAPGHAEFLRNMITGAAQADAALLLIDAAEGVRDQTRRHAYLLHLLGIHQVAVVINKMDRVGFDERRFHEIEAEIVSYLAGFGLAATAIIPISARNGDGVAQRTPLIAWHTGPTVLDVLDHFSPAKPLADLPLRIPVQAVYKFDDRRIIAGRIETGRVAVGDEIAFSPRGTTARIQSIEEWPVPDESRIPRRARAGQSVGLTLDRQIFVDRGDVISAAHVPSTSVDRLRARVFWLHDQPLAKGASVNVRVAMSECRGTVALIENVVDPGRLSASGAAAIAQNHVGEIEITLAHPIAADLYAVNPRTGRLVLELAGRIAGGGLVLAVDAQAHRSGRATSGVARDLRSDKETLTAQASRLSDLL